MPKASRQPATEPTVVLSTRETQMLKAIELLADPTKTLEVIASDVGITRRQLFTWRHDPFFRLAEDKLLDDVLNEARARLRVAVMGAVKVLTEALTCQAEDRDEAAKWNVRLQAAKLVLDRVGVTPETIRQGTSLTDEELDKVAERIGWLASGGKAA
jgi:hypothetical protein